MKVGQIKNIIFFGALFFILAGCTPKIFRGMENTGKREISKHKLFPIFDENDSVRLFNMQIDYKANNFTGILVVKQEAENSLRAIFTTLFGMTIFDFSFNETDFKVNRCMEQMQKKIVLNLMKRDFRTLFLYNVPTVFDAKIYSGKDSEVGYQIKTNDGEGYFLTNTAKKQLQKIEMPGCINTLSLNFEDYSDNFPELIRMEHPKIKLRMQLERIKQ